MDGSGGGLFVLICFRYFEGWQMFRGGEPVVFMRDQASTASCKVPFFKVNLQQASYHVCDDDGVIV